MQLLQRQAGHLNHSKAASRCVIRKNKAVQNKPLNILRSPPLPQRLHVSTTVLVIGALHLPSLHLPSLLARQRGGSAPSILLRCSPCLPRTALPLSSRHRSTAEHPCCAADHWAAATRCKCHIWCLHGGVIVIGCWLARWADARHAMVRKKRTAPGFADNARVCVPSRECARVTDKFRWRRSTPSTPTAASGAPSNRSG